ncbi:relaxase/mobilization nuclease domain-containing protein [Chamaesiphon sp.]|uniref:relaxase/mobilization nuclease domain-containing protein n=1 Tax=Chamaesiphon sp. TaxID=2814140 RepID=UPI003593FB87
MIGNITKGQDFGGLFKYLLHPKKNALIIGGNVGAETPRELEAEFLTFSTFNDRVTRVVNHLSVGFARLDGVVDPQLQVRIADRIINEMGYGNSQYLVVAHGRNDPGHDRTHDHDHFHIVANAVDLNGKWVDDFQSFRRFEKILREIEKDEQLTQIKSSSDVKKRAPTHGQCQRHKRELREVAAGVRQMAILPVVERLQIAIDTAAKESKSVVEMTKKLAERDIESRLKITRTGLVRGISYSLDGIKFQGNQLYDASLPKLQSIRGLSFDSQTDPKRFGNIDAKKDLKVLGNVSGECESLTKVEAVEVDRLSSKVFKPQLRKDRKRSHELG